MTTVTIAQQVAAMREEAAGRPPNELMGAFTREQSDLAAQGAPAGVIAPGTVLPDADLLDAQGGDITLYDALDNRPAVVVFYRGAWCPYCNLTLNTYQSELLPKLPRGVKLLAISPQTPDGSLTMREKNDLTFTVLSDPGMRVAGAVGIVTAPSPEVLAAQLQLGLDLTVVNADGTVALPMPTTIIVGTDRRVRWVDVHPDYTTRSEPEQILAALEASDL